MPRIKDVIEPRTHESSSTYTSWLRRIGKHTYRFKVVQRTADGYWEIEVAMSMYNGSRASWKPVHNWNGFKGEA